jgi:hypothetical protein
VVAPVAPTRSARFRTWVLLVAREGFKPLQRCDASCCSRTSPIKTVPKWPRYEAPEKNAVSGPTLPQVGNLWYSSHPRKPHFVGGFSAYSLKWKPGRSGSWRREWDSNPRYGTVSPPTAGRLYAWLGDGQAGRKTRCASQRQIKMPSARLHIREKFPRLKPRLNGNFSLGPFGRARDRRQRFRPSDFYSPARQNWRLHRKAFWSIPLAI